MKKTLISVTQADIDAGCKKDEKACPVAKAIIRTTGRLASVYYWVLTKQNAGDHWTNHGRVPRSVARFIQRFDWGKPVKPFRFFLNVPTT